MPLGEEQLRLIFMGDKASGIASETPLWDGQTAQVQRRQDAVSLINSNDNIDGVTLSGALLNALDGA